MTSLDNDGIERDHTDLYEELNPDVVERIRRDGTDACCDGICTDACGGYGRMLKASASDGIEGARPLAGWVDETHHSDGTDNGDVRRVAFIGQPGSGKTATASCCGERDDLPLEEEILEIPLPGFVKMFRGGKADLARRAKDIVRGTTASSDGICKCPVEACVCRSAQ